MKIRNPCFKCLINACCGQTCDDKMKFNKFAHNVLPMTCFGISLICVVFFIMFVSHTFENITIILGLMWFGSFLFSRIMFDMDNEYEVELVDNFIIFIVAPFLAIVFTLLILFEIWAKVDQKIL